jgi:hypothetical protein
VLVDTFTRRQISVLTGFQNQAIPILRYRVRHAVSQVDGSVQPAEVHLLPLTNLGASRNVQNHRQSLLDVSMIIDSDICDTQEAAAHSDHVPMRVT